MNEHSEHFYEHYPCSMNNNSSNQFDTQHHRRFQEQSAGYSGELNNNDNANFDSVRSHTGVPSREHLQGILAKKQRYSGVNIDDKNQCRPRGADFLAHRESMGSRLFLLLR